MSNLCSQIDIKNALDKAERRIARQKKMENKNQEIKNQEIKNQ